MVESRKILGRPSSFVREESDDIVFVPSARMQTEVVARTAVTVLYGANGVRPKVEVSSTSANSIIDNVKGSSDSRRWSVEEIEAIVETDGMETGERLFQFAKENSVDGQFHF